MGVSKLTELVGQAVEAGCPPFRQFSLQSRVANIDETMVELQEAGAEYKEGLEVRLLRHHLPHAHHVLVLGHVLVVVPALTRTPPY